MSRILIAEDARPIARGLGTALEQEGYDVRLAYDGRVALETARSWQPHFMILDLSLPEMDGLQVLRTLRKEGFNVPVLILSARSGERERIQGFVEGADDYVTKPFSLDELLARVDAHFRRQRILASQPSSPGPDADLDVGPLRIAASTRSVTCNGSSIALRPKEFDLLHALARHGGKVISRSALLHEVWGYAENVASRTVDAHIVELRRKIEADPANPSLILTVRKAGYRLATGGDHPGRLEANETAP